MSTAQTRDIVNRLADRQPVQEAVEDALGTADPVRVSWRDLYAADQDVALDLIDHPEETLNDLHEASATVAVDHDPDIRLNDPNTYPTVRLVDWPADKQRPVGGWSPSEHLGQLVVADALVAKATPPEPEVVEAEYEHARCGARVTVPQPPESAREPQECDACDRQGAFRLLRDQSELRDRQLLRLQEPPEQAHTDGTGGPRKVDATVSGGLCDDTLAGKRAVVSGILRGRENPDGDAITIEPYLDVHSIEVRESDHESVAEDISSEDRERIHAIANGAEGHPVDALADSVAPSIHGHEHLKQAIALQLLGGVHTGGLGGGDRGAIHVLAIGDPGTAKSTLLNHAADLAPRAITTTGKGATEAGITAAATQDDFGTGTAEWTLEAGALVEASGGLACVDELDKLSDGVSDAMHEAMSNQRVSVNKAGINATLPARASVLAAGNPEHGRFDDYESKWEQIDLPSTLVNRFDLFFLTRDDPLSQDQDDEALADAVIGGREERKRVEAVDDVEAGHTDAPIAPEMARKFAAYARREAHPTIESEAVREQLQERWIALRETAESDGEGATRVPVNARNLEAVMRLAEASARARLSDTIGTEDVNRATRLHGESMRQLGKDPETEKLDADVVETGTSKSQRDAIKQFEGLIDALVSQNDGDPVPRDEVLETAEENGIDRAEHRLESLLEKGIAYQPEQGAVLTT